MGTRRRSAPAIWFLFTFMMAFELCASLNHEGVSLLRLKDMIEVDPYGALLDWDEGNANPCSWFGVGCSDDGRVTALNLVNLDLKGILPPEIGKLINLQYLILRHNSFYSTIPTEIGDLKELKLLDLGYNKFNGPIPSGLGNIISLKFLFLKGNRLSCGLLVELHEDNRLSESENQDINCLDSVSTARNVGNTAIGRLLASKRKDLQNTKFIGIGPPFTSPYFRAPGPPRRVPPHQQTPPSSPLPPKPAPSPPPSEPIPPPHVFPAAEPSTTQSGKNSNSKLRDASIGVAIGFVVLALPAVCLFYHCHRKTSSVVPLSATSSGQLQTSVTEGITIFRLSDLEKACEGFSNIIGTLPGSTLFKGTLPCGAEIAVVSTTVSYAGCWSTIAEAHYKNKIEILSKVNHKNLMNLIGYCEDEEPFIRMMVFEYVSNGSLFEHLHVKEAEHLNWQSRLRIAMGVLYCLDYLHQQNPHVTIRNLNSSCIYLTEDNAAKVSDISFCDGKKGDKDEYDASDEYSSVYKFALLLLEIISGRRPYSDDTGLLVLWAHRYLTGVSPVMGMVDPTLNSVPEEHARALAELIRLCINDDRRQRPTLAEVARTMQEITGITQDQSIPRNSALWWAELEIIAS